ncbi:hypothetical protein BDZ97DRAFT_1673396 [Flammula alnicola]|nr:hypothetical protein BDZ97DRAFT_1673396 [Flammula alnicola]
MKDGRSVLVERGDTHKRVLTSFLNGTTKPHLGSILENMYDSSSRVDFRAKDRTMNPGMNMFNETHPLNEIEHGQAAMVTWAVRLVGDLVSAEAEEMTKQETGLHLRARAKAGGREEYDKASWDAIRAFRLSGLEDIAHKHAPIMTYLVKAYTQAGFAEAGHKNETARVVAIRKYRPQNLVVINTMMVMTNGRWIKANIYQMCRGIWLFASQAPASMYRVESHLGLCVSYKTVYDALREMGRGKRNRRIGKENKMLTGLAATAVKMEDCDSQVFDLKLLIERQARQERRALTTEILLDSLDLTHLENCTVVQFLQVLISFVPELSIYKKNLEEYAKILDRKPIPQSRLTETTPLSTNSANEMTVQGLREGILDFATTQMGIDEETLGNTASIWSGDGKTFNMLLLLKRMTAQEASDFHSFRWLIPLLELWHSKWTDLSRVVRTHWGTTDDPGSLATIAAIGECPKPSDMRKVDFFDGAHLVNLALDAQLLNCWELHFQTDDLQKHIKDMPEATRPSFEDLVKAANQLTRQHATLQAYYHALRPEDNGPNQPPIGSAWSSRYDICSDDDIEMNDPNDGDLDLPAPSASTDADITLANASLFIRNATLWREVCKAVADGDAGRVWEVWIFTFSGSGNPYYCQFLLEMFCCFKWEYGEALSDAVMKNWVVNLKGQRGHGIELDLMQEHHNLWLETLAQHKGHEFDETFYREVISPNVNDFLTLKDEMENNVALKSRTKKHGKPGVENELHAIMRRLREEEVNCFRKGRNDATLAADDFTKGLETLKASKLRDFITKSTITTNVVRLHHDQFGPSAFPPVSLEDFESELEAMDQSEELSGSDKHGPHHRMAVVDGDICMIQNEGELTPNMEHTVARH